MEKRRKQAIVIKCLFLAVVLGFVMMFVVGMCRSDARFFSSIKRVSVRIQLILTPWWMIKAGQRFIGSRTKNIKR